jgi:glutaconate CoA-transferase, subunit A
MDEQATEKVCTLAEAIARHVHSGDSIYLAGMAHGEASAAIHEILRQEITDLTIIRPVSEVASLLLAEGRVTTLIHAYTSDLYPKRGYIAKRIIERGYLPRLIEFSHFGLNLALLAGQFGVPCMLAVSQLGTDIVTHNADYLKEVQDPFTGQTVLAVRAITPDVGIAHVQRADYLGNAQRWGSLGLDIPGLHASRRIIVTAEKIVPPEEIRQAPEQTVVPGALVSAVAEVPWGAYPRHLYGYYDDDFFTTFLEAVGTEEAYETYMKDFVYGVRSHEERLAKLRERYGEEHFEALEKIARELTPLGTVGS